MELKHTPGSWSISHSPIAKTEKSNILNPVYYRNVKDKNSIGGRIIAKVMGKNIEEVENTAKLIAAAPDLLNACLMAYYSLSHNEPPHVDTVLKQLSEAIKKATE